MDLWPIPVLATVGLLVAHWVSPAPPEAEAEGFADASSETPEEDNPLDLPFIAAWTPLDREVRRMNRCSVIEEEEGPPGSGTVVQIVHPSCEDGMAHTRAGDRIMLPASIPAAQREQIIQHELIHISQRRFPAEWWKFYQRSWAFQTRPEPPRGFPDTLKARRRTNPDTWETPWVVWQGRFWPVPVYAETTPLTLRNASTVWWDEWRQEILTTPPAAWTAFFGTPSQDEHPHELAAVYLSGASGQSLPEAARRVTDWWDRVAPHLSSPKTTLHN